MKTSWQSQYLKTTPKSDLIQNKQRPASLGTDWIENERFGLVFSKTIIFMSKTGSINSGTGEYTTTVYVMVDIVNRGGRAPPPSPAWDNFSIMIECRARKWPLLLCALCILSPLSARVHSVRQNVRNVHKNPE